MIYHLANKNDWLAAEAVGVPYTGGAQDLSDSFIHLSTRD